ncbi:MAG TPA: CHAD domain-containing protein [Solirubrobacterales bacterium]|nr:CHAD domain-containing protein [Solirubrobacterales bacterium]
MALKAIRLDSGTGLSATFVPEAGMIAISLIEDGEELLGQRHGIESYIESGKTMGIPFLHPWANRLSSDRYEFGGRTVDIRADDPRVRRDENGLAIHGTLAASTFWEVEETTTGDELERAGLKATLDFGAHPDLLESFPFPHRITIEIDLSGSSLTFTTTITPTGDMAVPLAFGFHPYISLPGTDRTGWAIDLPPMTALHLDRRGIPNGGSHPFAATTDTLGTTAWDRAFTGVGEGAVFAVADERRMVSVRFASGFPAAQVFAPADENVICFEPMKAPTDALVTGRGLSSVEPGSSDVSRFTITVIEVAAATDTERQTPGKFRLDHERPAADVKRVARERVRTALAHLRESTPENRVAAIHDARKDIKKMRAVLRLVRSDLGKKTFRGENHRYRDAARLLSGSRDADVLIETVESLSGEYPPDAPPLEGLLRDLRTRRDEEAERDIESTGRLAQAAEAIEEGGGLIDGWTLESSDWALFERGLRRTYRDGRRAMSNLGPDPSTEAIHEWRKRVKDLWYQLRLLRRAWPPPLKAQAAETGRLAELLGDRNDLSVLLAELQRREDDDQDFTVLAGMAKERQLELLDRAIPLGHRIYAESPADFAARIGAYWKA